MTFGLLALFASKLFNEKLLRSCWTADGWEWRPSWSCNLHTSCISLDEKKLLELESGNGSWYCTNFKADYGLCSGAVLYGHKAVQCDKCEIWIHNKCSLITESEFDSVENTRCTWICPKCDFFNFSDSFFADQLNLENENRFDPLANGSGTKASQTGSDKANLSLD